MCIYIVRLDFQIIRENRITILTTSKHYPFYIPYNQNNLSIDDTFSNHSWEETHVYHGWVDRNSKQPYPGPT